MYKFGRFLIANRPGKSGRKLFSTTHSTHSLSACSQRWNVFLNGCLLWAFVNGAMNRSRDSKAALSGIDRAWTDRLSYFFPLIIFWSFSGNWKFVVVLFPIFIYFGCQKGNHRKSHRLWPQVATVFCSCGASITLKRHTHQQGNQVWWNQKIVQFLSAVNRDFAGEVKIKKEKRNHDEHSRIARALENWDRLEWRHLVFFTNRHVTLVAQTNEKMPRIELN